MKLTGRRQSGNVVEQGAPRHGHGKSPYEPALIMGAQSGPERRLVGSSMEKLRRTKIDKALSAKPDAATSKAMDRARSANPQRKTSRNPFATARSK